MESIARSSEQYAEAKKRKSTMQERRRERTLKPKAVAQGFIGGNTDYSTK